MTIDVEPVTHAGERIVRSVQRCGIVVLELNRPTHHNALDDMLMETLATEIHSVAADAQARALILTGAGASFCSGDDLKAAATASTAQFAHTIGALQAISSDLLALDKPVIAALNGPAFGAGLELALNCDIRIATRSFVCATPEVRLGLIATNGASLLLPLLIGPARARRMLLGGARVDAQWCLEAGLVEELTSAEELLPRAIALAEEMAMGAPFALAATRRLLNTPLKAAFDAALKLEASECIAAHRSADGREGIRAYLAKQTPKWLASQDR